MFAKYPDLAIRLFDVEVFSTVCSDIVMIETASIKDDYFMMARLRDSQIYTGPYLAVIAILRSLKMDLLSLSRPIQACFEPM